MKNILILISLFPVIATAQSIDGFYLGAGYGSTDFDDNNMFKDEINLPMSSDSGNAVKIIAGYQFNRIVSLETQYTNYGNIDVKTYKPFSGAVNGQLKLEHQSYTVAANVGYTFNNGLRPFGTIGLGSIEMKQGSWSDNGGVVRVGVGLEYSPLMLNGFSMRAAYEVDGYELQDQNSGKTYDQSIGSFYLGTTYKF
ncbi:porin family protein [Vibrio anguillarum]|uniref:Porin family protein n=2 Tax=Vibrio anguillarum TaxID=55601 RepID=A0ABR9Z718_VIBAN|nr:MULTISPECIES: outer membrane beta-barrel protein [Vibrio]ELG4677565.1 porin family protein [Vibrio cholerae]MBF4244495.1 porin family protein [Vibrio anguillarum]MBF4374254.1 porin family protein [Vibrio anguillarum]RZP62624.1 porin family protein [Vibrio vulnificus]RZR09730.1 porin family protein [Vibrio vulnificus]